MYDHCRTGSEIIRSGRKTMTCVWGHFLSPWCLPSDHQTVQSFIQRLLLESLRTHYTQHLFLGFGVFFFFLNGLKCCLGVFCFSLTLKACDSWEPHRIHKIYIASFTQFLWILVKTAFPFNENEGKGLLEWNAVVACLKINQHSVHLRIFTGKFNYKTLLGIVV